MIVRLAGSDFGILIPSNAASPENPVSKRNLRFVSEPFRVVKGWVTVTTRVLCSRLGSYATILGCFTVSFFLSTEAYAQSYTLKTLINFKRTNGAEPDSALTFDSSGNMYGTTLGGGVGGDGIVYEITAGTHTLKTLVDSSGTPGRGNLAIDSLGNLYGTISSEQVFKISAGNHIVSTIASFDDAEGTILNAGLVRDNAGNLYGTAQSGGGAQGTAYEIPAGTASPVVLATFDAAVGQVPGAGLALGSDGDLYGTTESGGEFGDGTVFRIAPGTDTMTTLASFNGSDGNFSLGQLVADAKGNIYGTTEFGGLGGDGYGNVFEIASGSDAITTLATFDGIDGGLPQAGLALDSSGNLYGTTVSGGVFGRGNVFEIAAGTHTLTTLVSFNGADGEQPIAGVTVDSQGNLYGTTESGGTGSAGTVFELERNGVFAPESSSLALLWFALPFVYVTRHQSMASRWGKKRP